MSTEKRLRVMVVDDQEAACDVVSETIRFTGHEVVGTERDGVEAAARAGELRPDLVVMDVLMPQMNGVEVMRVMLKAGAAQRVILMSGEFRSIGMTLHDLYRSGAAAFLEKPFDVNNLFNLLNQLSGGYGLEAQTS